MPLPCGALVSTALLAMLFVLGGSYGCLLVKLLERDVLLYPLFDLWF